MSALRSDQLTTHIGNSEAADGGAPMTRSVLPIVLESLLRSKPLSTAPPYNPPTIHSFDTTLPPPFWHDPSAWEHWQQWSAVPFMPHPQLAFEAHVADWQVVPQVSPQAPGSKSPPDQQQGSKGRRSSSPEVIEEGATIFTLPSGASTGEIKVLILTRRGMLNAYEVHEDGWGPCPPRPRSTSCPAELRYGSMSTEKLMPSPISSTEKLTLTPISSTEKLMSTPISSTENFLPTLISPREKLMPNAISCAEELKALQKPHAFVPSVALASSGANLGKQGRDNWADYPIACNGTDLDKHGQGDLDEKLILATSRAKEWTRQALAELGESVLIACHKARKSVDGFSAMCPCGVDGGGRSGYQRQPREQRHSLKARLPR